MTVLDTHSLIGIVRWASVTTAARLMADRDVGALGVYATDLEDLVGIVTERDITRSVARGQVPDQTAVETVMTAHPLRTFGGTTKKEAALLMKAGHVRHLIVREDGKDRIVSLRHLTCD